MLFTDYLSSLLFFFEENRNSHLRDSLFSRLLWVIFTLKTVTACLSGIQKIAQFLKEEAFFLFQDDRGREFL